MANRRRANDRKHGEDSASDRRQAAAPPSDELAPPNRALALCLAGFTIALAGCLLFVSLGHYALWEDEADTAIFALGVWRTGDTSAVLGENIYAFRDGAMLDGLRNRHTPPLTYYLVAPFVGLMGNTALAARLPLALCGLACVVVSQWWLWRAKVDWLTWTLLNIALLANVSAFLYARQCRYYALATLATLCVTWLYLNWDGRRQTLLALSLASIVLFAANYLSLVALYACIGVDYLVWRRKEQKLSLADWCWLLAPQIVVDGLIVWIWNPVRKSVIDESPGRDWLSDKLTLFWWNLRDLNATQMGLGLLLIAAPLVFFIARRIWLLRGSVALLIYVAVVTLLSPQPVALTRVADVRYLAPIIPLCIWLAVLTLDLAVRRVLPQRFWPALVAVAAVVFGSGLLYYPLSPRQWRSSIVDYATEISRPRTTPLMAAIDWINQNVRPGQSVWVLPDYDTYPLMYHAPQAVYAWQLNEPKDPKLEDAAAIHYRLREPVDFAIAFGPSNQTVRRVLNQLIDRGEDYRQVAALNVYWDDLTRPELFWRSFHPITGFNPETEAIYIYARQESP